METLPQNIVLIDKPSGMTSFDVIRALRRQTGIKKWGHAGTLDPLATGLMILGHDNGTKLLEGYLKLDKEYVAEVLIGERRSTGDMEGEIVEEMEVADIGEDELRTALAGMVGTLTLPVSAYSAIKKDGVPMYKRARKAEKRGEVIEDLPVRAMRVLEAELLKAENLIIYDKKRCVATVRLRVGSGAYVRSLAEELGKRLAPTPVLPSLCVACLSALENMLRFLRLQRFAQLVNQWKQRQYRCRGLGYPATIKNLRRTRVGDLKIEQALSLEALQ